MELHFGIWPFSIECAQKALREDDGDEDGEKKQKANANVRRGRRAFSMGLSAHNLIFVKDETLSLILKEGSVKVHQC